MRKVFLMATIAISAISFCLSAQDAKERETKMDQFASKAGTIVKFIDYDLETFTVSLSTGKSKVRKIISGEDVMYFYQVSLTSKYGTKKGSLDYEELIETRKAFDKLQNSAAGDVSNTENYIENKFTTEDGFNIGYYVSNGKLKWFMTLTKYGSNNTIFLKSAIEMQKHLDGAIVKIESLMQAG